ncbi:cache domain-containing protein [uncultured Thiodictyon sp.]|uniref:HAMP domain-containing protein n=1 Tax=uncultured Thiodictyon sp. TaxID=1846217 RepID=UPI0025EC37B9|nr:cache domain-containing protein [uncultured Thiodictyon sp.]
MFKNLRLWANITLGMGLAILLAIGALSYGSLLGLRTVVRDAERAELRQSMESLTAAVAAQARLAETLSALVANIPEVQQRFAAGDRAWLQAALLPPYQVLAKDYGAVQFQFHTPPATSFLRLHLPEKFGDDLSAIRPSVVDTNRTHQPHEGLEVGVAGLGVRGMVPIRDADRYQGVVEFGMSFGQPFFAAFKASFGVDAGLILLRKGAFETFAATYGERPLLTAAQLRLALDGEPQLAEIDHDGQPLAVYAAVIRDYSGAPLGVVEVARDRSPYAAALRSATRQAALIGGLALLLSLGIAQLTARPLSRRIRALADGVARVAAGDLSRDIPGSGRDELAGLADAANAMRRHLHALVTEVEMKAAAVHGAARDIA